MLRERISRRQASTKYGDRLSRRFRLPGLIQPTIRGRVALVFESFADGLGPAGGGNESPNSRACRSVISPRVSLRGVLDSASSGYWPAVCEVPETRSRGGPREDDPERL
jgi:hypothetical protein